MNKMTIVVALVAGVVGGVISRTISPAPVLAQQAQAPSPAAVELRAQRFSLVNQDGMVVGTFMVDKAKPLEGMPYKPTIRLLDFNGKEIWSAGGDPVRKLALK
jgi:hypothetical protein